ncbi:hypothetical protein PUN28_005909 [Cardiocondyla obscurior]|uniref:Secreted protein n=1 Tax=Cardiocondyla obscurior TaxID=286306 RepID=A0AAW2G804_9HYME
MLLCKYESAILSLFSLSLSLSLSYYETYLRKLIHQRMSGCNLRARSDLRRRGGAVRARLLISKTRRRDAPVTANRVTQRERKRMASCQSHLRKTSSTLSRGVCSPDIHRHTR